LIVFWIFYLYIPKINSKKGYNNRFLKAIFLRFCYFYET
jgi:hypothetical protein